MDLKLWFFVDKDLYFVPSYFVVDQGIISFQTGETIEQENFGVNFPWNRTDIWNEDITTTVSRKCVAYNAAPQTIENRHTNYTKGSSNLSIPLSGNRKYIFMLNFEIDDLTFILENLGKFIKRGNYYLAEEGLAFPDQSRCLSQKRLFRGSADFQLESYMCCFA
uniref:Uncharacterized protein n=1 Tax=Panagrolaimus sp. PS1159 TaxID=55785 RepID=A0AC35F985_9BILA